MGNTPQGMRLKKMSSSGISKALERLLPCFTPSPPNAKEEREWNSSESSSESEAEEEYKQVVSFRELSKPGFTIKRRYEIVHSIGQGTFGKVYAVRDKITSEILAAKVSKRTDGKILQKEMRTIQKLNQMDPTNRHNIVSLVDGFRFKGRRWMIIELLEMNVQQFLRICYDRIRLSKKRGLPMPVTKFIAMQVLEGMSYMSKNAMIHTDLKPQNIMLRGVQSGFIQVKIVDFGSVLYTDNGAYPPTMQTRSYRSIEAHLRLGNYTEKIDVWSLGCIIAEMHIGAVLFPARSRTELLHRMVAILGSPKPEFIATGSNNNDVVVIPKLSIRTEPTSNTRNGRPLLAPIGLIDFMSKEYLKFASFDEHRKALTQEGKLIELVAKMLKMDPAERISIVEIFYDPFFQ